MLHGARRPNEAESVLSLQVEKGIRNKMCTYSEDLFMTTFFTRMTCGVSASVLVAGGGATPTGGVVPNTAMVTDAAAEAAGSIPISWHPGPGGEAGGL
jgi:hypothetical protein